MKNRVLKRIQIKLLKLAIYILSGNNVQRAGFISRRDNNRLYGMAEQIHDIINRMEDSYEKWHWVKSEKQYVKEADAVLQDDFIRGLKKFAGIDPVDVFISTTGYLYLFTDTQDGELKCLGTAGKADRTFYMLGRNPNAGITIPAESIPPHRQGAQFWDSPNLLEHLILQKRIADESSKTTTD